MSKCKMQKFEAKIRISLEIFYVMKYLIILIS